MIYNIIATKKKPLTLDFLLTPIGTTCYNLYSNDGIFGFGFRFLKLKIISIIK